MSVIVLKFTFESSSASELQLPATYPNIYVDHLMFLVLYKKVDLARKMRLR